PVRVQRLQVSDAELAEVAHAHAQLRQELQGRDDTLTIQSASAEACLALAAGLGRQACVVDVPLPLLQRIATQALFQQDKLLNGDTGFLLLEVFQQIGTGPVALSAGLAPRLLLIQALLLCLVEILLIAEFAVAGIVALPRLAVWLLLVAVSLGILIVLTPSAFISLRLGVVAGLAARLKLIAGVLADAIPAAHARARRYLPLRGPTQKIAVHDSKV